MSKEQRQAAINAETLENRPDAVEVAQPTKGKRVRVETVTLSGPKTVTANLYELPGYKGPQLAVAEYKSSRGQGYKVYLPKSGAFIHDSNGVQPLNEALKQAVLRIDHARQTLGAKAVPTPTEALTTVKSLLQPAPRKATVPTDRKPLIARKNSEILADLNKQIDERLREAAGDIDELEARTDADPKVAQALKAYKDAVKEAGDAIVVRRLVPLSAQWKQYQATGKTKLTEAQKLYDELQAAEAKVGAAETERDIRSRDLRDARNAAGARVTVKSGGTSYTVANTTEALARLRDAITKDQGFKDGKTPKVGQKATGGVTTKRAPKAVVQDFVADGDFENAQALAEHYGIDIKAGMDAKQKRAYQDWLDSRDLH